MYKLNDKIFVFPCDKGREFQDIMRPFKHAGSIPPEHIEGLHQGTVQQRNLFWMLFNKQTVSIPPLYAEGVHQGTVSQRHFTYTMLKKMTHEVVSRSGIDSGRLEWLNEQASLSLKNTI